MHAHVVAQHRLYPGHSLKHRSTLVVAPPYRDDDGLDWSQFRRQDQPLIVAMYHHHRSHHARAEAPTSRPHVLEIIILVKELDVERLGEILPEEVTGARLERLIVPHHRLNGITGHRSRELLTLALTTSDDRDSSILDGKVGIDVEHAQCFFLCFLGRGVGGMPFLP